jgi:hypothetical protein
MTGSNLKPGVVLSVAVLPIVTAEELAEVAAEMAREEAEEKAANAEALLKEKVKQEENILAKVQEDWAQEQELIDSFVQSQLMGRMKADLEDLKAQAKLDTLEAEAAAAREAAETQLAQKAMLKEEVEKQVEVDAGVMIVAEEGVTPDVAAADAAVMAAADAAVIAAAADQGARVAAASVPANSRELILCAAMSPMKLSSSNPHARFEEGGAEEQEEQEEQEENVQKTANISTNITNLGERSKGAGKGTGKGAGKGRRRKLFSAKSLATSLGEGDAEDDDSEEKERCVNHL